LEKDVSEEVSLCSTQTGILHVIIKLRLPHHLAGPVFPDHQRDAILWRSV
jgi:hypothetical protein